MDDRMKEILDKIRASATVAGEYASDQVNKASKKAGEMIEITKLNLQIFDLNAEIGAIYKEISEMIYATHIDAEAQVDNLEELLVEVDVKKSAHRRE